MTAFTRIRDCVGAALPWLLVAGATPALAQYETFVPIDVMGTAMSGAIMDAAQPHGEEHRASDRIQPGEEPVDASAFNFVALPSRTQANIRKFATKNRKVDPQGADALEALFASTDVMGMLDGELKKVALRRTNLADAYTVYWTNAWLGTQRRTDNLSSGQMSAVRCQASAALSKLPQVVSLDDAGRQELAEALLVQAMLISASVEAAEEQPNLIARTAEAISKGAQATGLDLSSMVLTADGFLLSE